MIEDYKPNSNKYKELQNSEKSEEKHVEKIVNGPVKTRKKSKLSKFTEGIISNDAKSVKSYVIGEVLIPAIKKAISDVVTGGIDILLFGESRNSKRSTSERISYRSYYDNGSTRASRMMDNRSGVQYGGYSFDDVILSSRGEAESVLNSMDDLITTYGLVRVADFYDLVGVSGNYTDNKYGWMNITSAEVVRVRDGYMIKLPRAVPID